jgi:hypothetical protein
MGNTKPAMDTGFFSDDMSGGYWVSTNHVSSSWVWAFGSHDGSVTDLYKSDNYPCGVRAVRGGQNQSSNNFIDNGNGTVTDTQTNLMWQQGTAQNTMLWKDALAQCENLSLGGYQDWRLPNIKELFSIVDYGRQNPAINTQFFTVIDNYSIYWSSTTVTDDPKSAWIISLSRGMSLRNFKYNNSRYVRCVRGG